LGVKLFALFQALEDISVEKQTQKEKYERELKNLQERASRREKLLLQEHENRINELLANSGTEHQNTKQALEDQLESLRQVGLLLRFWIAKFG
jgi:phage regulator Rha-like protein